MPDEDALARYFGFLETEFGAKRVKLRRTRSARTSEPTVLYATLTTAVSISYEVREAYLDVRLYPLENGKVPSDAVRGLHGFPLNHIVALKTKADLLGSAYDHEDLGEPGHRLEPYFERVVDNLRRYADHFLRGDFSLVPKLLPTLSKRAGADD